MSWQVPGYFTFILSGIVSGAVADAEVALRQLSRRRSGSARIEQESEALFFSAPSTKDFEERDGDDGIRSAFGRHFRGESIFCLSWDCDAKLQREKENELSFSYNWPHPDAPLGQGIGYWG